ncbi:hypothetical protein KCTC52924_02109 [Arenibacter antarcticus]|uniref:Uncharacterized protein n=1 Tax=Arenibacter antarcticus TaxID=2040469 RepID=A0ABW5VEN7_9FLAO|nr:hypothetical protein [Arenibacter sp. H213]MCM4168534.1 hypothetical protein [Arenibacter sp. H213]
MKYLLILCVFFNAISAFAQKGLDNVSYFDEVKSSVLIESLKESKSNNQLRGSYYLFKDWETDSKIYYKNKIYAINRLNYNLKDDHFEAKFEKDSIFVINPSSVDKVVVNGKTFQRFGYMGDKGARVSYFENIVSFKGATLLKYYAIKIKKGAINPLTKEKSQPDELVQDPMYYIKRGTSKELETIKLRKSHIFALIEEDKKEMVTKFAKQNKLKFNKIDDVAHILKYYNSI